MHSIEQSTMSIYDTMSREQIFDMDDPYAYITLHNRVILDEQINKEIDILQSGSLAKVQKLLTKGLNKFFFDPPLCHIVRNRDPEVTRYFLENFTYSINKRFFGDTPLKIAARQGNFEVIKLLVKHGADITRFDKDHENLVHWIKDIPNRKLAGEIETWFNQLLKDNPRLAEHIEENKQKIKEAQLRSRRQGALGNVFESGTCHQVKALLKRGLDTIDLYEGAHPLHYAAKNANPEVIIMLLEHKTYHFDVNITDENGWTPLDYAARYNDNPEVIKILIEHGAKVGVFDEGDKPEHVLIDLIEMEHDSWVPQVEVWLKSYTEQKQTANTANENLTQRKKTANDSAGNDMASPIKEKNSSPKNATGSQIKKWLKHIFHRCSPEVKNHHSESTEQQPLTQKLKTSQHVNHIH